MRVITRSANVKYKGSNIDFKKDTKWDRVWKDKEEYYKWLRLIIKEFSRVLQQDRHLLMFCDKRDVSYIISMCEDCHMKVRQPLVYMKTNPAPQAAKVSPSKSIEIIVWATNGRATQQYYNWQLGKVTDVIKCSIPRNEGAIERHPTQKPLYVGYWLVSRFSKPDDVILDPFAGSGTFLRTAKDLGRQYIGSEVNVAYYNAAQQRIKHDNKIYQKIRDTLYHELYNTKPSTVSDEEFNSLYYGKKQGLF